MNREIIELREVVTKLIPMLVGKGLTVTQRGSQAFVRTDAKTRKPILINIPNIPDSASPEFILAIQGFIDHEVGHVLITDWDWYGGRFIKPKDLMNKKVQRFMNLHNIVEDTMIEPEMGRMFPGSKKNISNMRKIFLTEITIPALSIAKTDKERFAYMLVVVMRALAGHTEFQEFMDGNKYWEEDIIKEFVSRIPADVKKILPKMRTTKETHDVAKVIEGILYPTVQPPVIDLIDPAEGYTVGQQVVEITGSNFIDVEWVKFDNVNAILGPQTSAKKITLLTPPHAEGLVDVTVKTEHGEATKKLAFEYITPPPAPGSGSGGDSKEQSEGDSSEQEAEDEGSEGSSSKESKSDKKDGKEKSSGKSDKNEKEESEDTDDSEKPAKSDESEQEEEAGEQEGEQEPASSEGEDEPADQGEERDADPSESDEKGEEESSEDEGSDEDSESDSSPVGEEEDESGEDSGDAEDGDQTDGDPEDENEPSGGDSTGDDDENVEGSDDDDDNSKPSAPSGDEDDDAENGSGADEAGEEEDDGSSKPGESEKSKDRVAIQTDDHDAGEVGDIDDDKSEGDPGGGVGSGLGKSMFDFADDAFEKADTSSQLSVLIENEAVDLLKDGDYNVFTREFDRIEKLKVPDNINPDWVPEIEGVTNSMTGRMAKDIERMMAAQSHVVKVPGFRSGRLNGPSLHRIINGDERLFNRKQEHKSKDTAVSLLIDNSGSMSGEKMMTAMISGYALALTLERVNIPSEVIGFTTGDFRGVSRNEQSEMNRQIQEAYSKGVRFHRTSPIIMPIYKEFDERINAEVKRRVAYAAYAQNGMVTNIDGESLEYAAIRLLKRREKRKVMLVLSDGQPAGAMNVGAHLKQTVEKLTAIGIDLVGIGIKDAAVRRFYKNNIVLQKVEDLPTEVMRELKIILSD